MHGLNLDQVNTNEFREELEQVFIEGITERADIDAAVLRAPGGEERAADSNAGWTNLLLNMMVAWAASEGWQIDGHAIHMKARPEALHLPAAGPNMRDPEYLTDIAMYELAAGENGATWAEWLTHPERRPYRGILVAVESEWGGALAATTEAALDEMMADFYKILDSRCVLGIFIHWLPLEAGDRDLVLQTFEQSYLDHRSPPPVVCIGFDQATWEETIANPPTFTWLGQ